MRDKDSGLLLEKFTGIGEVKGKIFEREKKSKYVYIYKVDSMESALYYEVFLRKIHKIYGTETYPSSKQFGKTAFTTFDKKKALNIFKKLNKKQTKPKT